MPHHNQLTWQCIEEIPYTLVASHALVYFTEATLNVVTELTAGFGKVRVDIRLWMVSLEVPQLHQTSLCAGFVTNHLEDVCQASLCLLLAKVTLRCHS